MRKRDTSDVMTSALAVLGDACAVMAGFVVATDLRFYTPWIPVLKGRPPNLWNLYLTGAAIATLLFLFIFRSLGLYVRPQTGSFSSKIPRLMRGIGMGLVLAAALGFTVKTDPPFSALVLLLALPTTTFFLLLERYILFRVEWNLARHSHTRHGVLILGTDSVAAHVQRTLRREPMLRSRVIGFLRCDNTEPDPRLKPEELLGSLDDLPRLVSGKQVDQIILTTSGIPHAKIVEIILLCEKNLITFNMVPDLFRIMTNSMDVQSLDDIPLLGLSSWPLDHFWNRALKRAEDVAGSILGLILAAPILAVAAVLIKRSSPGPVFYRQERCGENGHPFALYKLRTMRVDAEQQSGPVFARQDDPRTTPVGAFLRRWNLDELPQLWNVLRGDMCLVGPRPERPHFVERFKEDIAHYMWRHVSKPGMTGWAQVNGLRGNTSIDERIKYDLYYLENWSLAFDFKILLKTVFARENAY